MESVVAVATSPNTPKGNGSERRVTVWPELFAPVSLPVRVSVRPERTGLGVGGEAGVAGVASASASPLVAGLVVGRGAWGEAGGGEQGCEESD